MEGFPRWPMPVSVAARVVLVNHGLATGAQLLDWRTRVAILFSII